MTLDSKFLHARVISGVDYESGHRKIQTVNFFLQVDFGKISEISVDIYRAILGAFAVAEIPVFPPMNHHGPLENRFRTVNLSPGKSVNLKNRNRHFAYF